MYPQVVQYCSGRTRLPCATCMRFIAVLGDTYIQMPVSSVLSPREASRFRSRIVVCRLLVEFVLGDEAYGTACQ